MAKIRDDVNEYGTPITVMKCEFCGVEFTLCPAVPDERLDQWDGCLDTVCSSYDPARDVDAMIFFGMPIERRQVQEEESRG